VQVDPIKPTLKAPGAKRLKLKFDDLVSIFAFNVKLRRYAEGAGGFSEKHGRAAAAAGRCRLTLSIRSCNRLKVSA
jgi:hypothetical protein